MLNNTITSTKKILFILVLTLGIALSIGHSAFAQEDTTSTGDTPAVDSSATDAAKEDGKGKQEAEDVTLLDLYKQGKWAMHPLLLLSVILVGLTIYNAIMLREKPFLHPEVVESIKEPLKSLDIERARELCEVNPSVVTNIFMAGLDHVRPDHLDPEAIEKAMEASATEEMAAPFVLVNYLNVVAGVAPMLGLLGTVSGMIKAFNKMKTQGMGKPQELAGDISEALITTATGLVVAIPALISYFYFKNKYGVLSSRVSRLLGDLYYTMMRAVHTDGSSEEQK